MSLPVVLRPEASQDVEEVRDYLEGRQAGLGQAFLDRLKEVLGRVGALPGLYGVVWRNVRAARLRLFPFVVYYRVHDDRVEVLGKIGVASFCSCVLDKQTMKRHPICPRAHQEPAANTPKVFTRAARGPLEGKNCALRTGAK